MTDYWKSGEMKWCEHCEVYIRFNLVKQHQQTPKHRSRVERTLTQQRAGRTKEGMAEERVKRELARMERLASGAVMQDVAAGRAQAHETTKTFDTAPRKQTQFVVVPLPRAQAQSVEEEFEQMWKEEQDARAAAPELEGSEAEEEARRKEEEREREEHERQVAESKRRDELAKANYDPLNPFGAWVEVEKVVAPPEPEDVKEKKTRKQIMEEENERFEEDVEDDVDANFKIERMVANSSVYNDAVVKDEDEEPIENVVFKKKAGKERNARKKAKTDINDD